MPQSELATAHEKNFMTQSTLKRNSRYYDIPAAMNLENQFSIKRRQPLSSPTNSEKLQSSFTNSTSALSVKVNNQIGKFRNRVSLIETPTNYQRQYSSPHSPKLKSFSIQRMSSRQYQLDLKNKPIQDQRMFNNFKIQKHDLSKTCDFGKLKSRNMDIELKHLNDIYHESHKPYQYCYYKTNSFKTKVSYKQQNKQQKRHFFKSKRKQDFPATVLNPEKVDNGLKIASNFKGSNLKNNGITPFYLQTDRNQPSLTDNRYNNNLTNFRRDTDNKIVKPELDFTMKKMKEQLQGSRRQRIAKTKRPEFTRDEICDERYFKMNKIGK